MHLTRPSALLLMCLLLAAADAAGGPGSADTVTLQLRWWHQFQFAGYYAAQEKGFYAEEGLSVRIRPGGTTDLVAGHVANGEAEYGVSGTDILVRRLQGKAFVVLAAIFQHSAHAMAVRAESGIRVPTDLAGKRIMASLDRDPDVKAMLLREGVDLSALQVIPDRWDLEEFMRGGVDAITCYTTTQEYALQQRGVGYRILHPADFEVDFYGDCLFTTEREVQTHPERVAAFRRASLKGWHYAMEHPGEIIELILARYRPLAPGVSREALAFEAAAMRGLVLPDLVEVGTMSADRWKRIAGLYADVGMIDRENISLKGFLFEPERPVDLRWVRVAALCAGIAVLGVVAVLFWNMQLRTEVRRRTGELQAKNAALEEENASRRKAELALRESEGKLRGSLLEKEVLLKEIHHRVKNNLQVISSLLSLQAERIVDEQARDVFRESQNRVRSMALIHERLYRSADLAHVDFGEYVRNLTATLFNSYRLTMPQVECTMDVAPLPLDVDVAIPCGLILNELVSNALKYAFPGGRAGRVAVRFAPVAEGRYRLEVSDNGVGLGDGVDLRQARSLGFQLVDLLADQIRGTLQVESENGLTVSVSFAPPRKERTAVPPPDGGELTGGTASPQAGERAPAPAPRGR